MVSPVLFAQVAWDEGVCIATAATLSSALYALLTVLALASLLSSTLKSLSSHGKTRSTIADRRFTVFTVPKQRFRDFYIVGFFVTCAVVSLGGDVAATASNRIVFTLVLLHLARRYHECAHVHRSTSSSRMHVAGYALGILHYLCLPFVLVTTKDVTGVTPGDESNHCDFLFILGCIFFQYQQHRHHLLLAKLRAHDRSASDPEYSIPIGGWFRFVSCPHYFAEIMIYFTLAKLGADDDENAAMMIRLHDAGPQGELVRNILSALNLKKRWFLLVWVATNLSISAYHTHEWYRRRFRSYPAERKRLLPLIW